ncbi:MAG TPA: DUF6152 family protein [Verrucomicrobiae bacterium]|jgi:hypothetical protein
MKTLLYASVLLVVLLAGSTSLSAHHGNASYENKQVTIKGKVTKWLWTNPHSFLMLDVTDENGKVVHWVCENQAPSTLVNFGFTAQTFKPGDEVTVVMAAVARNGTPVGRITRVILADGYVMNSEVR